MRYHRSPNRMKTNFTRNIFDLSIHKMLHRFPFSGNFEHRKHRSEAPALDKLNRNVTIQEYCLNSELCSTAQKSRNFVNRICDLKGVTLTRLLCQYSGFEF